MEDEYLPCNEWWRVDGGGGIYFRKSKNMDDREAPINAAKIQKVVCAFDALILAIPKLM